MTWFQRINANLYNWAFKSRQRKMPTIQELAEMMRNCGFDQPTQFGDGSYQWTGDAHAWQRLRMQVAYHLLTKCEIYRREKEWYDVQ